MNRALAIAALMTLIACDRSPPPSTPPGPSNITAADYIGPAACGECHPKQLATWKTSLHATMTPDDGSRAVTVTTVTRDEPVATASTAPGTEHNSRGAPSHGLNHTASRLPVGLKISHPPSRHVAS